MFYQLGRRMCSIAIGNFYAALRKSVFFEMLFPQQAFYSRRRADVIFHVGVARFWPFDDPFEI